MNSSVRLASIHQTQAALQLLGVLQLTGHLWPKQASLKDGDKFDFVIVGAGTAGCVMANRLSEDPDISVLLIEAGGDPPFESEVPILYPYLKNSRYDWNYTSVNDHYTKQFNNDHVQKLTRGKMLGGSSSINGMAYMRGNAHDYDTWAEMIGDETWKWKNVLPYFMKSERLEDPATLKSAYKKNHNTKGLLGVNRFNSGESNEYLDAFAQIGHKISVDIGGEDALGYMRYFFTISNKARQSTARSFLTPAKERSNLHVLKDTMVKKIILDDNLNAIGVEVNISNKRNIIINANKEVILSAGAFGSPQLLMLSGIGPKTHLKSKGIEVKVDLPVGKNLQDHGIAMVVMAMGKRNTNPEPINPYEIPGDLFTGFVTLNKSSQIPQYQTLNAVFNDHTPILDFCAFYFEYNLELCDELFENTTGRQVLFSLVNLLYPQSRGKILLKSSDINDHPEIYTGAYTVNSDLENHAAYLKDFLKVTNSDFFKSVNSKLVVPKICKCQKFDYGCKDFWKCYILCMGGAAYHYVGTCAAGAVVDSRLRVMGVKKLRVVDSSVISNIIGAPTNAATIMVAEKAADFVKDDYYSRA